MKKTTNELKEAIQKLSNLGATAMSKRFDSWHWKTQTGKKITPQYIYVLRTQLKKPVQPEESSLLTATKTKDAFDVMRDIYSMDVPVKYKRLMWESVQKDLNQ